ncbi:MAG: polysaccharide deacetylase family protein [Alphaproteobacteria bacterium]|nr:polysaccharide deacetylase family protein [Alphaproteobacteria bacterium]
MAKISLSFGRWVPVLRKVGSARSNEVAITIDDAPTPEATPGLLSLLSRHKMLATFFVSGFRAERAPGLVQSIIQEGHAVYAHGWEHIRLDRQPSARLIDDMTRAERLLAGFRPTPTPYLVRLPYNGGYRNAKVHQALASWMPGCQIAHWGLSTKDHMIASNCVDERAVAEAARIHVGQLLDRPNLPRAIILMHDQPVGDLPDGGLKSFATLEVMRSLAEGLAARNLTSIALKPEATPSILSRFLLV